jgi:hypothetical protein
VRHGLELSASQQLMQPDLQTVAVQIPLDTAVERQRHDPGFF